MTRHTLLLLPALMACYSAPEPQPPVPAAPLAVGSGSLATSAPEVTLFPSGTYRIVIADNDLPATTVSALRSSMVGTWVMTVDRAGRAVWVLNGRDRLEVPYSVNGQVITFSNNFGPFGCNAPARYTWVMNSDRTVSFTRIDDPCDARVMALTLHPWVLQP